MVNIYLKKYIWDRTTFHKFSESCKDELKLFKVQSYNPILSLYLYYHNTKNSKKLVTLNLNNIVQKILNVKDHKFYNSNKFAEVLLHNINNNTITNKNIFIKSIPLIDPINYIMNNYNLDINNSNLPYNYNYNTYHKINSLENSAYVETLFSHISNELVSNGYLPSLPLLYASINGITHNYKYDISEEYEDFRNEIWFHKNIGKLFSLDIYTNDDFSNDSIKSTSSNSNMSTHSNISNASNGSNLSNNSKLSSNSEKSIYSEISNNSLSTCDSVNDYIININNIPVQNLFIEQLEGTLDKILFDEDNTINYTLIKSCLFQINFALLFLQKYFKFSHNDLHINNIMYKTTDKKFLYYKFNNQYFRVPTFGKIFKIIDFGRCIFNFKNKTFINDVFSKYGEADKQYNFPNQILLFDETNKSLNINYHFDMCRLCMTIIEELNLYEMNNNSEEFIELFSFLNTIVTDKNGTNIVKEIPNTFKLYIHIVNNANKSLPRNLIQSKYFNKYIINKKQMPIKYYKI